MSDAYIESNREKQLCKSWSLHHIEEGNFKRIMVIDSEKPVKGIYLELSSSSVEFTTTYFLLGRYPYIENSLLVIKTIKQILLTAQCSLLMFGVLTFTFNVVLSFFDIQMQPYSTHSIECTLNFLNRFDFSYKQRNLKHFLLFLKR